jgi:hypothetical protein
VTAVWSHTHAPGGAGRVRNALRAGIAVALLLLPLAARAEDLPAPAELGEAPILSVGPLAYRPGRGLRIDDTGLVIGGFTNIKAEDTTEGGEFSLDSLNLFFIFDRFTRFRAVAELQFKDIFTANKDAAGAQDFAFDVRRLFGDFTISDALRLRTGTFLTPVGYWNLILAPPLTWTTEAPLIVEKTFFQPTTTGVMLYGSTGLGVGRLGYSLFSQFLHPLEDDPDLDPPDYTAGARLTYDIGTALTSGATFQAAEDHGKWTNLGALDLLWEQPRWEVLSECYFQGGNGLSSAQWGAYVQGVVNAYGPFFLVARYEHFDEPTPNPTINLFTFGGVLKPVPFMAIKVEYRHVDHTVEGDDPSGFFSSFTTFF